MNDTHLTREYGYERLSISCLLVSTVFFLVLSQAFIIRLPEIATQVFRPLIVFFLVIRMHQRGEVKFGARTVAMIAAVYCAFVLVFIPFNTEEIKRTSAVVLYLLMFWAVCGTPWNRREVRFIIMACFVGAFVCSIAFFISNDPTDLHVGTSGEMNMLGVSVNRNKNAYAFSIGTIIGILYLLYGSKKHRIIVLLMTALIAYGLLYSQCRGAFFCTVVGVTILVAGILLRIKKSNEAKSILYSLLFIVFCMRYNDFN